jgi:hypothetical protein
MLNSNVIMNQFQQTELQLQYNQQQQQQQQQFNQ